MYFLFPINLNLNSNVLPEWKLYVEKENLFVIIISENNSNKLSQVKNIFSSFSLGSKSDLCSWDFLLCMPLKNSKAHMFQSLYEEVKLEYRVESRVDLALALSLEGRMSLCISQIFSIESLLSSFILLFPTLLIATDYFKLIF